MMGLDLRCIDHHFPHMDKISAWNVRGLNWPNKQVDVQLFLHANKVGLVGLLETKAKKKNVDKVAAHVFLGWRWINKFSQASKGRLWVAWKPSNYNVKLLDLSDQFIHCQALRMSTKEQFYITFVYG